MKLMHKNCFPVSTLPFTAQVVTKLMHFKCSYYDNIRVIRIHSSMHGQ